MFSGALTVVFRASNSRGVFLQRVSDKSSFFLLLSKLCVCWEVSLKIIEFFTVLIWV